MNRPLSFPAAISPPMQDLLTRMLAISEAQRVSLEEVEKLLELYEQGEKEKEEKSYHWTLVRRLMLHEAEHRSQLQFQKPLLALTHK
jgi:DNA-binding transcriptional MerR regulator